MGRAFLPPSSCCCWSCFSFGSALVPRCFLFCSLPPAAHTSLATSLPRTSSWSQGCVCVCLSVKICCRLRDTGASWRWCVEQPRLPRCAVAAPPVPRRLSCGVIAVAWRLRALVRARSRAAVWRRPLRCDSCSRRASAIRPRSAASRPCRWRSIATTPAACSRSGCTSTTSHSRQSRSISCGCVITARVPSVCTPSPSSARSTPCRYALRGSLKQRVCANQPANSLGCSLGMASLDCTVDHARERGGVGRR